MKKAIELDGSSNAPASLYQPSQAVNLMRFLPATDPYAARGSLYAVVNMHERARADFDHIISSDSVSSYSHFHHALACLRMDDLASYQIVCSTMIKRFADSTTLLDLRFTAWSCLLGPNALNDYDSAIEVARRALEPDGLEHPPKSWSYDDLYFRASELEPDAVEPRLTLGGILYRAERYKEALECLEAAVPSKAVEETSSACGDFFLAMTHQRLQRADDARRFLDRANQQADRELKDARSPAIWNRRFTLNLLRKEAESLIGKQVAR